MRTWMVAGLMVLAVGSVGFGQTGAAAAQGGVVVKAQETKGLADARAGVLLSELTLEEKIGLLSGAADGFSTKAVERLGIPSFTMSDGPNGVRNGPGGLNNACAFPCGAALAATWDPALASAYGKAVGLEGRARGTHFQLGPGLNICRVPVNGRNFEYFGEDPYLAGVMAARWAKACSEQGVVPTIKHFAANNQETNRNTVDAEVEERVLREIYLPAFERAVKEGGILSVMCSYNRLNGSYASNNSWLLTDVLKKEWGFDGLVMSDWGASHAVSDLAKGLDLEMPNGKNLSPENIKKALADGTVTEGQIDAAVRRLLRTAAAMGWLDTGWVQKKSDLPLDSEDSARVALEVARASMVLLKNEKGALPLDRTKVKRVVVVGPNAGGGTGGVPANIGGGGSGAVQPFGTHAAEANYLQGLTDRGGNGVNVVYLPMPEPAAETYGTMALARTAEGGEAGLKLKVQVTGQGDAVEVPESVQPGVNLKWEAGQAPLVPAGRTATYIWSGVLVAPEDGDWQVVASGANVTIAGKGVPANELLHLEKGKAVPVVVTGRAVANGGRRGGQGEAAAQGPAGGQIRVAFVKPLLPDMEQVKTADAAIVCVGLNRNVETEGRDRPFELPPLQQMLIKAVAGANGRTIVVNNSGAAVRMEGWIGEVPAVVQAWYLGQEGGLALGDVLFGDVNPSGKLVSTFDRRWEENPAFANYPGKNEPGKGYPVETYTEGLFYGYRGYDQSGKEPLFPFGHGLSYSRFELTNVTAVREGAGVKVGVNVRNSGEREGAEVVQVYVGETGCPVPRPVRELKGFEKVVLKAGDIKQLELHLPGEALGYWNPDKKAWVVDEMGSFAVEVGVSEGDIRGKATISGGK